MTLQEEIPVVCPYCGEDIPLLADPSVEWQEYIEDCQVCCQPIEISARCEPGRPPALLARRQDEI